MPELKKVSLGLGLTSACNLGCAHCYRPLPERHLSFETVCRVCEKLDVDGVNLGTGESALHPEFHRILSWLLDRGLKVSLVSNGLSVAALSDEELVRLHDVEVSVDFPRRADFDLWRGEGAWDAAVRALDRCRSLGVRTTMLAVMMRANHLQMLALARVAAELGAPLRVNAYQPVKTDRFLPTPGEFWLGVECLFAETTILGCSEPVVAAVAGIECAGPRCGRTSLRVTPSGELLPCVYWPESWGSADEAPYFVAHDGHGRMRRLPDECRDCELREACAGGCAARRVLTVGLDKPDPYCPAALHPAIRPLARQDGGAQRLHVGNVCTLLVQG